MNPASVHEKPVRLRDRLREETAGAILAAAEDVFAEQGLKGARMESIAARAGVAVGTLYNHFEDKGALLDALRDSRSAALLARLDAAIEGHRPFRDELRSFLCALFSHWAEHKPFLSVLLEVNRLGAPARSGRACDVAKEIHARGERIVRHGIAEGALRGLPADVSAAVLVGMARGVLVHELSAPSAPGIEQQVDRLIDLFLHGAGK